MPDAREKSVPRPTRNRPDAGTPQNYLDACDDSDFDVIGDAMEENEQYEYTFDKGLVMWLRENIIQREMARLHPNYHENSKNALVRVR